MPVEHISVRLAGLCGVNLVQHRQLKRLALTNDVEELKLVLEHGRKPDCCLQLQGRFGWSVIAVLQDSQLTGRIPRPPAGIDPIPECDFTRVTGNQFAKA
jgi:hypothetical protein